MKRIALLFVGCLLYSVSAFAQAGAAGTLNSYVTGTLQSGATANGNGTALAVRGLSAAQITVNCSVGCSGGTTINFEVSEDGTNFVAVNGQQLGTNTIATTVVNQNTTPTVWEVNVAGLQSLRARISAYSAGTITVTATAIAAPFDPKVVNSNQAGTWTVQPGNTANTTAWKVDGSAVTQPVSGTVTTTPPSNASTNVAQVAGTTADTNSGNKSAGTLRVVLATDQPALTNKLLVTPDSVALPANQSVNAAQVGGTNTDTNSGNKSAGTLRVVLATDQPQLTNKLLVTPDANVKVNAVGNGGASFDAATGAAPPANAVLLGGLASGATGGFVTAIPVCDTYANVNISTATTTLLVTGVSGRHVRICSISLVAAAADNVGIISGTGATCGTGTAAIVGTTAATGFNLAANGGIAQGSGIGTIMRTVATGDSVCAITSATTQLSGVIAYTIY